MSRTLIAMAALLSVLTLSGCGNKGPLYLPDEPATATDEPAPED